MSLGEFLVQKNKGKLICNSPNDIISGNFDSGKVDQDGIFYYKRYITFLLRMTQILHIPKIIFVVSCILNLISVLKIFPATIRDGQFLINSHSCLTGYSYLFRFGSNGWTLVKNRYAKGTLCTPKSRVRLSITLLEMLVINDLMSSWVGQLFWQGASAHFKHL
jgi:hypothetical protein